MLIPVNVEFEVFLDRRRTERYVAACQALDTRLRERLVPVELEIFRGVLHGFLRATDGVKKSRDAVARAGAWLRRHAV